MFAGFQKFSNLLMTAVRMQFAGFPKILKLDMKSVLGSRVVFTGGTPPMLLTLD